MPFDKFEDEIIKKRPGLDVHEPPQALWSKIDNELGRPPAKLRQLKRYWSVAASIVLALGAGFWFLMPENAPVESPDFPTEYLEAEAYYTSLIDERQNEIQGLSAAYPEIKESAQQDLDELDSLYHNLKHQFKDRGEQKPLIDAMILNLQQQVEILNLQLQLLQNLKENTKEDRHESTII